MATRYIANEDSTPPAPPSTTPYWNSREHYPDLPDELRTAWFVTKYLAPRAPQWFPAPWYAPSWDAAWDLPPRAAATPGHPYRNLSWMPPAAPSL